MEDCNCGEFYEIQIESLKERIDELEAHCDSMEEIAANAGVELLRAEERIAELEAEAKTRDKFLSEAWEEVERLKAELAEERALGDDYQEALEDMSKKWAEEMYLADMLYKAFGNDDDFANQADAAYRKARGL